MSSKAVIWKTNPDNLWRLYTHTDYKLHEPQIPKDPKETKPKAQAKPQLPSPFSFTKLKPLTKGSMACTTKGYGIIQSFNEDRKSISVKIEGVIQEFPEEEVFSEVPLSIMFMNNSLKTQEVIYTPTSCTLNEVLDKLENSLGEGDGCLSVSLFFNGKELEGSTETLEKLRIMPWSKLLGVVKLRKPLLLKRYINFFPSWNLSVGSVLGLCFMPSKTMRIIGFGVCKPNQNTMMATASLISGSSIKGDVLWSKSISITETTEKEAVEKVMFTRPYLIKQGEFASITLTFTAQCMSHYGNGGKPTVDAEGDISFTFKIPEDMPSHMNGHDAGQFPEIYYYV